MFRFHHLLTKVLLRLLKQPIGRLQPSPRIHGCLTCFKGVDFVKFRLHFLVLFFEEGFPLVVEEGVLSFGDRGFGFEVVGFEGFVFGLVGLGEDLLLLVEFAPFLVDRLGGLGLEAEGLGGWWRLRGFMGLAPEGLLLGRGFVVAVVGVEGLVGEEEVFEFGDVGGYFVGELFGVRVDDVGFGLFVGRGFG